MGKTLKATDRRRLRKKSVSVQDPTGNGQAPGLDIFNDRRVKNFGSGKKAT